MPTLTGSRTARTVTLCVLYAAQGMPYGFVTVALVSHLVGQGAEAAEIAEINAWLILPWTFKAFWGPVIDRFTMRSMGRRRPWILFAQLALSATLLAMILIRDLTAEMETLYWMVFVHNCFVSLQDVASDALAVDVLLADERGRVNGMMWASNYAGSAIGGAGMGTVIAYSGLRAAFCLQTGLLMMIFCLPLFFRERAGEKLFPWSKGEAQRAPGEDENKDIVGLVKELLRAFASRAPLLGLVFALAAAVMVGMRVAIVSVFFQKEVGWTEAYFSQIEGGVGAVAGVVGALLGGFLADRVGVKAMITISALGISALCAAMGASEELWGNELFPMTFLLGTTFLLSMMTVASFSLFMRLCKAAVAGTQYTLYMAMMNLGRIPGTALVAGLADSGYRTTFLAMAVAIVVPLLFLYPIRQDQQGAAA